MENPCPFWKDNRECASRHCGIDTCDDEVPAPLRRKTAVLSTVRYIQNFINSRKKNDTASSSASCFDNDRRWSLLNTRQNNTKIIIQMNSKEVVSSESEEKNSDEKDIKCITSNQFDPLDRTLSEGDKAQLRDMDYFEDNEDKFCDMGG